LRVSQIYDFEVVAIDGETFPLERYRGRPLLIVNVASRCGMTPQYAGLEALYRKYKDRGLVVLGFPCNQFGGQEPGTEEQIEAFCRLTYDITFPMFRKIDVNGPDAHPLFTFLKAQKKGLLGTGSIKWNFTKFLVDERGNVVARFGPRDTPEQLEPEIERALTPADRPTRASGSESSG
jgi:glutathione peroxidase